MREILRTTNEYSCDTENEINEIIAEEEANGGEITKKTVEKKQKKSKGEIVAEKFKVTIQCTYAGIFDYLNEGAE